LAKCLSAKYLSAKCLSAKCPGTLPCLQKCLIRPKIVDFDMCVNVKIWLSSTFIPYFN
jgi:hypothetical protein